MLDHLKLKAIQPEALHVDMDELRDKDLTHHNTLKTRLRNNKIAIILHSPHLYKHLSAKGICELKDQLEFVDESFEQEPAE
ncbi:hypothetical protein THOM_0724 [Trachipleistophora hominis]|uniref:Uncharacterized protein n=1 Tax=Trachipleistophora hominis TaxID=72359 RepID=L7JY92_TRAHO|nr:hypothetical protein THOM_0724 [Trachipleistophora hominis]